MQDPVRFIFVTYFLAFVSVLLEIKGHHNFLKSFNVKDKTGKTVHINHISTDDIDMDKLNTDLDNPDIKDDDDIKVEFNWENVDGEEVEAPKVIGIKKRKIRDLSTNPRCLSTNTKSGKRCQRLVKREGLRCHYHPDNLEQE